MNDNDAKKGNRQTDRGDSAGKGRPKLREVVADLDRDILRLLLKRHNLIGRMAQNHGRLDAAEEKFLRQSWEAQVSRVSHDARLARQFFTLMQEADFLPRPDDGGGEESRQPQRSAFNLAPAKKPVRIRMDAPLDGRDSRAWLMLAAASGEPMTLSPCLMNDPEVDCLKAIDQLGAALNRGDGATIEARRHAPADAPDKVLYMGGSVWNVFLVLAHYLGRPSRAKFTGDAGLKMFSFANVRNFLPLLGARLVPVVPGSDGLPVRVECSGMLPDGIDLPHDVPIELAEAMALAAPFYPRPISLGLAGHPGLGQLEQRTLPILADCGASFRFNAGELNLKPGRLSLPKRPPVPLEPELGAFLLALPLALGGETCLGGIWPKWASAPWNLLMALGLNLTESDGAVTSRAAAPLDSALLDSIEPALALELAGNWLELTLAVAALPAQAGRPARLPAAWRKCLPRRRLEEAQSFLAACGLVWEESGALAPAPGQSTPPWTAPDPAYALAYALAACRRPGAQGYGLVNPGIMTELYPSFWTLYNSLPDPQMKKSPKAEEAPAKRRRLRTQAVAVLPEVQEEE